MATRSLLSSAIAIDVFDSRNIQDRSLLKVYNKDPAHAFNHTRKLCREIVYARGDGPGASRPGPTTLPPHAIPNSPPSTPVPHSMPPSPSRIRTEAPAQWWFLVMPPSPGTDSPACQSPDPSPQPQRHPGKKRREADEDMSGKNLTMYGMRVSMPTLTFITRRMSIASSHGGHPLDVPDHIIAYHRTAIRSASAYCNPSLQAEMHMEQSLYRQKPRKYPESHLPTLGSKTPGVSSPVGDLRMVEMHDRASPSRQGFKKEPGTLVYIEKPRTTPGLSGIVDLGPPLVEKQVFAHYSKADFDREFL
uniref:Uncharacterized protein n=1 Tax=Bos mutus grunniens TaxID=30521 RepID=A0A8B9YN22_BOSMU